MSLTSVIQQSWYVFFFKFLHPEVAPVMGYMGNKDNDDDDPRSTFSWAKWSFMGFLAQQLNE
jgi:hypothetical protein